MLKNILMLSGLLASAPSFATEMGARQALVLVAIDTPGKRIKFMPDDNEMPSFSLPSSEDFILIPMAEGWYETNGLRFNFKPNTISG